MPNKGLAPTVLTITRMLTSLICLAAILAAGFFIEVIAASSAPVGYEDENGFHFGPESTVTSSEEEAYFAEGLVANPT